VVGGLLLTAQRETLRKGALGWARLYAQREIEPVAPFVRGFTPVPASGKVIGQPEIENAVDAVLDGWLTEGRWTAEFEKRLAAVVGVRYALMTNSGSSANLAAIAGLTGKDTGLRRLKPGDEVLTAAVGFPTTVSALLWNRLVPVFVDVELGTYVPSPSQISASVSRKTAAIFMAHTLGNPLPISRLMRLQEHKDILIIEDNCDALGSLYKGKPTGSFGVVATQSFYPAHHITTGEGGAVLTNRPKVKKAIESVRDWGRSCWCDPGKANTCGKRFDWCIPGTPGRYDHKYIYDRLGFNLKSTDLQAALGVAQLTRLAEFGRLRRANFAYLFEALRGDLEQFLILPFAAPDSDPSWFGFPITVREGVSRDDLVRFLDKRKVDSRHLFGGNLLRQPAFKDAFGRLGYKQGKHEPLPNSDRVMRDSFWVGVWPGLTGEMMDWIAICIRDGLAEQVGVMEAGA
jgi:CDP-6-deoxy-D-xylo-4-hexulose-3-dehydrase